MELRWLICAPISILLTLFTYLISPLLATPWLCVKTVDGREYLRKYLYWFQSFDAPLDEWRVGTYWETNTLLDWDFTKWTHRYLARVFWLCRNPAYGFAQFPFGVEPGLEIDRHGYGVWDGGDDNSEYTEWLNAFNYRAQFYFTDTWFLRINIGWKAHAGFSRLMLATHIWPRKYKAPA